MGEVGPGGRRKGEPPVNKLRHVVPVRVLLLILGTAVTAGLMMVHSFTNLSAIGFPELVAILVFGGLAAASHFRPSWSFNQQATYCTVVAAYFAVAMVLPRTWIAPVIILSWLPWIILHGRAKPTWPAEVTFNVSLDIIAAVVARDLYHVVQQSIPFTTLSLVVGALTFMALQTTLVTAVVVLYRRVALRAADTLKVSSLSADLIMVLVGGITALLYRMDPMSLFLVFLPLGYLQHMMERVRSQKEPYLDSKTGLFNYKYLDERLPGELERAKVTGIPLTLVFADLDYLREINNNYGHLAGDVAIRHVSDVLRACVRNNQFAARFGGEEFVLVLPQTDHGEALQVAEAARALVADSIIQAGDTRFRVTMSFGVATAPDDAVTVRDLIHAADTAVYEAKAGGRNCIRSCRKEVDVPCAVSR